MNLRHNPSRADSGVVALNYRFAGSNRAARNPCSCAYCQNRSFVCRVKHMVNWAMRCVGLRRRVDGCARRLRCVPHALKPLSSATRRDTLGDGHAVPRVAEVAEPTACYGSVDASFRALSGSCRNPSTLDTLGHRGFGGILMLSNLANFVAIAYGSPPQSSYTHRSPQRARRRNSSVPR